MRTSHELPADLETPISAYRKLAPLGPRFLLESAGHGARFSLLGFGPLDEYELDRRALTRNGIVLDPRPGRVELLASLRQALAAAPELIVDGPEAPFFRGGLVGVLGYEFARHLERLPATGDAGPALRLLAPRAMLVFDHARRSIRLHVTENEAKLAHEARRALRGTAPRERPRRGRVGPLRANQTRAEFLARVARAQEAIHDGEVYQLVLSCSFQGEAELEPLELYRALRAASPAPYHALFEFDDLALIGASPEALVRLERGQASLQPIAGTRPRCADPVRDAVLASELLADRKEAAEHVMLVDLARNDLGRVAVPGSITVAPFSKLERFSHVMHLVSGVHGTLEAEADAFDCLAACFPAGTVVGAPKLRAMELIDELEPEARGLYGGTFGTIGQGGTLDQALTIRTLFLQPGSVRFQAGAGIVAESDAAREHDEILAKGAALRCALELAAEGRP